MATKRSIFSLIVKIVLRAICVVVALVVLIPALLYLPPIQDFAVDIATKEMKKSTGMDVEIGQLRLRWPIKLSVSDVKMKYATGDTMLTARRLDVGVAVLPLLRGQISVNHARLDTAFYQLNNADSLLWLRADIDYAKFDGANVRMSFDKIFADEAMVDGARVKLIIRPDTVVKNDTTKSKPVYIRAKDITMRNVEYMMMMEPIIDTIRCSVPSAHLKNGLVHTGMRIVYADEVAMDSVTASYWHPLVFPSSPTPATDKAPAEDDDSGLWTVVSRKAHLTAKRATYAATGSRPLPGLDMDYLEAREVTIDVDSFYNRGADIRVPLRTFLATERCGVSLDAVGTFEMEDGIMRATDFKILTGASRLVFDGTMGIGDLPTSTTLPLALKADGILALSDFCKAFPVFQPMLKNMPAPRTLAVVTDLQGTSGSLNVKDLRMNYPGLLNLKASGQVNNPFNFERLGGDVNIDGKMTGTSRLRPSLVEARLLPGIGLPETLTLKGRVKYNPGNILADLNATADDGRAMLKGAWNGRAESYDLDLSANSFPVNVFLPDMGIGNLTAEVFAKGHGYNPMKKSTEMNIDVKIDEITYQSDTYRDIRLTADAGSGRAKGYLSSANPNANLDLNFMAANDSGLWKWDIDGTVHELALKALHLSDTPLGGSLAIKSAGSYSPDSHTIDGDLSLRQVDVVFDDKVIRTPSTDVHAVLTDSTSVLNLSDGDFMALFSADCKIDSFAPRLMLLQPTLHKQIKRDRKINVDSLQDLLPQFSLSVKSGRDNLVAQFLRDNGLDFNHFALSASNDSVARLSAQVLGFQKDNIKLDSISLNAFQRGGYLIYNANVANSPGTMDEFAQVAANGYFGNNRLNMLLRSRNIEGQTGYKLGLQATTVDSTLTFSVQPTNIVVAYQDWSVNEDNHITLDYRTNRLNADLAIENSTGHFHLYTEPSRLDTENNTNDLVLNMAGIHLQDWLNAAPFMPKFRGELAADMRINWDRKNIVGIGTASITDLCLGKNRVGSFDMDFDVKNDPVNKALAAEASLKVDSLKVLTLRGLVNDSTSATPTHLECELTRLPLRVANPFLPAELGSLKGYLNGRMEMTGDLSSPKLNGWVSFDSTSVYVAMMKQAYKFSQERIPVDNSVVSFDEFAINGANENPLIIDGNVNFSDLINPTFDLYFQALDMMLINTSRSRGAQIYGKAYVSLDANAKGNLERFRVNANLSLLSGTNATLVLASSQSSLNNLVSGNSNMVKFVNFNDTTQVEKADSLERTSVMFLNANLNIEDGAIINVDLSADSKNKVQIQGQGAFTYEMSPLNSGTLTGRYTISKGFVRYTPPLLSEKLFEFIDGSYVAFNGDMSNPTLNLHAVDRLKTNVTQEGQDSRIVNFDVGLSVTNSLNNMDIKFDLSTNDDITVANELQSMSPDQRASQAMNLLLYNVYTGPGTKANSSLSGNILFGFLESRVNSLLASAIPGVDISLGIEQYDRTKGGTTSTTTNYTYRVSKSLFDDRFKIVVGGNYNANAKADENFSQNLINDISFEYLINRSGTMYVKLFSHKGYETVFEGEITVTGVGFVFKRKFNSLRDLFGREKKTVTIEPQKNQDETSK